MKEPHDSPIHLRVAARSTAGGGDRLKIYAPPSFFFVDDKYHVRLISTSEFKRGLYSRTERCVFECGNLKPPSEHCARMFGPKYIGMTVDWDSATCSRTVKLCSPPCVSPNPLRSKSKRKEKVCHHPGNLSLDPFRGAHEKSASDLQSTNPILKNANKQKRTRALTVSDAETAIRENHADTPSPLSLFLVLITILPLRTKPRLVFFFSATSSPSQNTHTQHSTMQQTREIHAHPVKHASNLLRITTFRSITAQLANMRFRVFFEVTVFFPKVYIQPNIYNTYQAHTYLFVQK